MVACFSIVWNVLVLAITPFILQFYNLADETKHLIITLIIIHNIANTVVFPLSGPLSQGLRATGDVKFTMIVSIASTVGGRLVLSIILALGLHLGCYWYCPCDVWRLDNSSNYFLLSL